MDAADTSHVGDDDESEETESPQPPHRRSTGRGFPATLASLETADIARRYGRRGTAVARGWPLDAARATQRRRHATGTTAPGVPNKCWRRYLCRPRCLQHLPSGAGPTLARLTSRPGHAGGERADRARGLRE